MITKNYIITEKGRKNGLSDVSLQRERDHIVCATEYDYYGQSTLYVSSYFKNHCLVGVSVSADKESEIDSFIGNRVKYGYLQED